MQLAQITNPVLGRPAAGQGVAFLQKFIPAAVNIGFVIGVIFFVFMLISGAIQWISSGGDKQSLEAARGRVTNAIIGIVILLALYAVINLVASFFGGINILNPTINPLV